MTTYHQLKHMLGQREQSVQDFATQAGNALGRLGTAFAAALGLPAQAKEVAFVEGERLVADDTHELVDPHGTISPDGFNFALRVQFGPEHFDLHCLIVPHAGGLAARIGEDLFPLSVQAEIDRWALLKVTELEHAIKTLGTTAELATKIEHENEPQQKQASHRPKPFIVS